MEKRTFVLIAHGKIANYQPLNLRLLQTGFESERNSPTILFYTDFGECAYINHAAISRVCSEGIATTSGYYTTPLGVVQPVPQHLVDRPGQVFTNLIPELFLTGSHADDEYGNGMWGVMECHSNYNPATQTHNWAEPIIQFNTHYDQYNNLVSKDWHDGTRSLPISPKAETGNAICMLSEVIQGLGLLVGNFDFNLHVTSCLEYPANYNGAGFFDGSDPSNSFSGGKRPRRRKTKKRKRRHRKKTKHRKKRRKKRNR